MKWQGLAEDSVVSTTVFQRIELLLESAKLVKLIVDLVLHNCCYFWNLSDNYG